MPPLELLLLLVPPLELELLDPGSPAALQTTSAAMQAVPLPASTAPVQASCSAKLVSVAQHWLSSPHASADGSVLPELLELLVGAGAGAGAGAGTEVEEGVGAGIDVDEPAGAECVTSVGAGVVSSELSGMGAGSEAQAIAPRANIAVTDPVRRTRVFALMVSGESNELAISAVTPTLRTRSM